MDPNLKDQTLNKLTKAENILICAPIDSGIDHLASALALYLSIEKIGKNVQIVAKEPTVGEARKLYAVSKIGNKNATSNEFIVAIDNAVDTVDRVTHFLDQNKLKIVIHPLPGTPGVDKSQISFEKAPKKPDFIIAIGINSFDKLKKIFTHEQKIDSNTWIVSIQKGQTGEKYAQVNVASPDSKSYSEVTAQFLQALSLPVNEDIAFNLYSGIAAGTNNFAPNLISPLTFQIASWLVKFGAGKASLAQKVDSPQISQSFVHQAESEEPEKPDVFNQLYEETPIQEVEGEKDKERDWLKPPRVYKGSKSFDSEN